MTATPKTKHESQAAGVPVTNRYSVTEGREMPAPPSVSKRNSSGLRAQIVWSVSSVWVNRTGPLSVMK
jgi:hypothetical protein